jgi:polyphosphate kinase
VQIDLVVRGICCLRPGVPGLSENIRVKSIVGRFLEHGRISASATATAAVTEGAGVHLSADWMPRNLDRPRRGAGADREPDRAPRCSTRSWSPICATRCKAGTSPADGTYKRVSAEEDGFSAHTYFMTNPSLSGRGKALRRGQGGWRR